MFYRVVPGKELRILLRAVSCVRFLHVNDPRCDPWAVSLANFVDLTDRPLEKPSCVAAQRKYDGPSAEIGQPYRLPMDVMQLEIGRKLPNRWTRRSIFL